MKKLVLKLTVVALLIAGLGFVGVNALGGNNSAEEVTPLGDPGGGKPTI